MAFAFNDTAKLNILMSPLSQHDPWVKLYRNQPTVRKMIATQFET